MNDDGAADGTAGERPLPPLRRGHIARGHGCVLAVLRLQVFVLETPAPAAVPARAHARIQLDSERLPAA